MTCRENMDLGAYVLGALSPGERSALERHLADCADCKEELVLLADKAGTTLPRLAIAFVLAHPAVTSAIIGPRTMEQLDDLVAGADLRLDDATLDAIDELVPPGTLVDENDRGFDPWWFEPRARRR